MTALRRLLPEFATLAVVLGLTGWTMSEEPLRLREAFPEGYQYHVSSRVELAGKLLLPPEKGQTTPKTLKISGDSAIEYDERVLAVGTNGVDKTARIYRRVEMQRLIGDGPQQSTLRVGVRRLVLLRHKNVEVPFSPDGPLTWNEIDLIRTDVFTPALAGMLPSGLVRTGDRWTAAPTAIQELTDLERIEEGQIDCRLEQFTTLERRRLARITFAGTVRGVNEDGPNRQQLDGYFFFDLESQHICYMYIKGTNILLDKDLKEKGRIEGRFVLTRQAHQRSPDLTDQALRGIALEPNAGNTLLLYDNPELGVRFLYPRRWRMASVRGNQVALDEKNGSGLLLTVEASERMPTGAQFLAESRGWLAQQKAKVWHEYPPERLQVAPQELEHFAIDMQMADQRAFLDYYVIRQPPGGATVAARLPSSDSTELRKEVEAIARSVTRQAVGSKK